VPSHKRKKKRSFDEKYGDLPAEEVVYDISDKEKICEKCGSEMTFMKYEIRRELKIIPAKITVVEHKKAVYVCKECDKNGIEASFKTAEATPALIEKSLVSPSLMAHIMYQKFCNAMPLYRQEQDLKRMGIQFSRQTMANWVISGAKLLQPLYEKMHEILLAENILHADETPLEVLCEPNRPAVMKSYMWLYRTGKHADKPIVLYDYKEGRSGDYAKKFLTGFSGYLHCDGYSGYNKLENTKRVGCWAHVRRKFLEALEAQSDKTDFSTIAGQGFLYIEKLFSLEHIDSKKPLECSKLSLADISEIREKQSKKLVSEFFSWAESEYEKNLPQSLVGKALSYAINQKSTLIAFLKNSKLELTNNRAERSIKPFVIGRKNWLFCNTPGGANSSAIVYSIIETAKENNLKPYDYLVWLFEKIRSGDDVETLLPWSDDLPKSLKLKTE
jgi:transposase